MYFFHNKLIITLVFRKKQVQILFLGEKLDLFFSREHLTLIEFRLNMLYDSNLKKILSDNDKNPIKFSFFVKFFNKLQKIDFTPTHKIKALTLS